MAGNAVAESPCVHGDRGDSVLLNKKKSQEKVNTSLHLLQRTCAGNSANKLKITISQDRFGTLTLGSRSRSHLGYSGAVSAGWMSALLKLTKLAN